MICTVGATLVVAQVGRHKTCPYKATGMYLDNPEEQLLCYKSRLPLNQ
jgi:hypothetical protein